MKCNRSTSLNCHCRLVLYFTCTLLACIHCSFFYAEIKNPREKSWLLCWRHLAVSAMHLPGVLSKLSVVRLSACPVFLPNINAVGLVRYGVYSKRLVRGSTRPAYTLRPAVRGSTKPCSDNQTSPCPASYASRQRDTARVCCCAPCCGASAARRLGGAAVDPHLLPARRSAANPPRRRAAGESRDGQTEKQTDAKQFQRPFPAFPAQRLRPSVVLSCWPDGLELTPGFYPGSNEQHRLF